MRDTGATPRPTHRRSEPAAAVSAALTGAARSAIDFVHNAFTDEAIDEHEAWLREQQRSDRG